MLPFGPVKFDQGYGVLVEKTRPSSVKPNAAASTQTVTTTGWCVTMRMFIEGILRDDALLLFFLMSACADVSACVSGWR
jgi:hypothetical protein